MCFACDPSWSDYVIIVGEDYTLILDEETCDSLNGGCIDFYAAFVTYVNDVNAALTAYFTTLGFNFVASEYSLPCNNTDINVTDGSNITCKDYICSRLFKGAEVEEPSFESQRPNRPLSRSLSSIEENTKIAGFAKSIQQLTERQVARVFSLRRMAAKSVRDASTQNTVYQDNGYPLYSVGEESSLDKSVSSASSLGVSALLVAAVALLAFFF